MRKAIIAGILSIIFTVIMHIGCESKLSGEGVYFNVYQNGKKIDKVCGSKKDDSFAFHGSYYKKTEEKCSLRIF